MATNNDDWRQGEPILNIIDPDLFVFKHYDKKQYSERFRKEHESQVERLKGYCDRTYVQGYDAQMSVWDFFADNDKKGFFMRAGYQWLATEFEENKQDGSISITSPIHNLAPRSAHSEIYDGIEHVFEQMLPLFNKFEAFKDRESDSFQVIVKSQRYCIEDGSGYKGHWHKEGLTENIVVAGLYYIEKDELLGGGTQALMLPRFMIRLGATTGR